MVTGIVRRFERGNIIVDLGRAEAIIPIREQCPVNLTAPAIEFRFTLSMFKNTLVDLKLY